MKELIEQIEILIRRAIEAEDKRDMYERLWMSACEEIKELKNEGAEKNDNI